MDAPKNKIAFTEEKETLLIPLYGKAMENKKKSRSSSIKRRLRS